MTRLAQALMVAIAHASGDPVAVRYAEERADKDAKAAAHEMLIQMAEYEARERKAVTS